MRRHALRYGVAGVVSLFHLLNPGREMIKP